MRLAARWRRSSALLLIFGGLAVAADQPKGQTTALIPATQRKPTAAFSLKDASGKTATLKEYRGKVVLLDFWATWCHGCTEEIPWFSDFQKSYGGKGLAVIGASMDEGGWNVLKPFLAARPVPYRMLLADEALAKQYGIENLPDTFLIDRKGRIAAAYLATLVDKDDVDSKIKTLLAER